MQFTRLLFVVFTVVHAVAIRGIRKYMKSLTGNFDSTDIFEKYVVGSMGGYLSPSEFKNLMVAVRTDFPEIVRNVKVGKTFLGV